MTIIQLPASATRERNLLRTIDVLNRIVPDDMEKGIQLFQTTVPGTFDQQADSIARTARHIPEGFHITLHAPFCAHDPNRRYNLAHPDGYALLRDTCRLAERIGCETVVAHFNTTYARTASGNEQSWKKEWDDEQRRYTSIVRPAFENIRTLSGSTPCTLAFENLPIPIHGDKTSDAQKIFCDPCMSSFEFLDLFAQEFRDANRVGLCFDVSHYGLSMGFLNQELGAKEEMSSMNLYHAGAYPLYPDRIRRQPPIRDALRLLERHRQGMIKEIQLADYGAVWKQKTPKEQGRLLEEGVGILEGSSSFEVLEAAAYAAKQMPATPIAFDVAVDDVIAMTRQIMGILLFLDFLHDPKKMNEDFSTDRSAFIRHYKQKAEKI